MATLLDERLDDEEQPDETEQAGDFENDPVEQETQSEIPDKYKGKSAEDLVRMHQEAEKLLGRQSSEVGELRQVVDSYIQTQLSNQQAPQQQETVDEVDFFSDPEEAVKRAIDNHPKIREAENISKQYQKTTALSQLQKDHPDMQNILTDDKFAEWIKAQRYGLNCTYKQTSNTTMKLHTNCLPFGKNVSRLYNKQLMLKSKVVSKLLRTHQLAQPLVVLKQKRERFTEGQTLLNLCVQTLNGINHCPMRL